jgi:hypothetical protein
VTWNVENTDEFGAWWNDLTEAQQEDITATVTLLEERGAQLAVSLFIGDREFEA